MDIIHANQIGDQVIAADICIIGAGPAGMTLARKLSYENLNIVIADSGGKGVEVKPNELNKMYVESNFRYRNGESNRVRQIGGTASIWAGRAVPFTFDPELDNEWGGLASTVKGYYDDAFRHLNIDPEIQINHPNCDNELYGYWAFKTQRFKSASLTFGKDNIRMFTNLTFIGEAEFDENLVSKLRFVNQERNAIYIRASRFIFAMGGIENSRMLLIMKDQGEKRMGDNFRNVGKYIMDHPRIVHGSLIPKHNDSRLMRYQMTTTTHGIYKTGIRNLASASRVYCNIKGSPDRLTKRALKFPSRSFQYSAIKLLMREAGVLKTVVHQIKTLPLIKRSTFISESINRFVNTREVKEYRLMTYCEQRPRLQNEIVLDKETDRNNLQLPRLKNSLHQVELNEALTFYRQMDDLAKKLMCRLDYDEAYVSNPDNYTDASHIMGGTRYSSDKSRAVVDDKLSVIGIPNIHVIGSSVFPTSGVENPTHLIVCLSLYLADELKKEML